MTRECESSLVNEERRGSNDLDWKSEVGEGLFDVKCGLF